MADFTEPLPQAATASEAPPIGSRVRALLTRQFWVEAAEGLKGARATRLWYLVKSAINPLEFSRPTQAAVLMRIAANARAFWPVYVAVVMLPMLLWTLLSSTWLFAGTMLMIAIWTYAYFVRKDAPMLDLLGVPVPKMVACGGGSLLIMLVTGMISAFVWAVALGAAVALPHMVLHNGAPEATAEEEMQTLQPV